MRGALRRSSLTRSWKLTAIVCVVVLIVALGVCFVEAGLQHDSSSSMAMMHLCLGLIAIALPLPLLSEPVAEEGPLPSFAVSRTGRTPTVLLPPPKLRSA